MKASATPFLHVMRILCATLMLVLALPEAGTMGVVVAHAQEKSERRGGGLLRFLFPRQEKRERPAAPAVKKERRTSPRRNPAPAPPPVPVIEKAENAKRVLVVGDFLAGSLADGLTAAYAENPDIMVIGRTNGSSGLVRDDFYDWPGNIATIIEDEKPVSVVIMIGANDRQQLLVDGNREQPGSEAWVGEYERRARMLAKAVRDKKLSLLWVGALPFKSSTMTSDMVVFNDIYRRITTDEGGEFIDVWDGFVDESGKFAANGPDMNGQPVQLRGSDGINITRPGRRKIAFYLEKPLARLLGLDETGAPASLAPETEGEITPVDPGEIERTAPIAIDDLDVEADAVLLGAKAVPASDNAATLVERPAREAIAPDTRQGRADDFLAPPPSPETPADTAAETTGAPIP